MSKPSRRGAKWRIRWIDESGKRNSQMFDDYKDADYALKKHRAEVEDVRRGFKLRPSPDRAFTELCDKWLEVRSALKRKPQDDESIIRVHLKPAFGGLTLRQITAERIAEFSADLVASRKASTVRNILTLLGAMFNQAVEWGWVDKAPRIRKPRVRLFSRDYRWLRTEEEIVCFLSAAKSEASPVVYPMYATALFTGMRAGELAGLRWGDVDFSRRLITVQRSYNGPTKAGDIRHVPILDRLLPTLREWKLSSGSKRIIFPNETGNMWDQKGRIYDEILKRVLVNAGFDYRYVHFHGLRHTFASHWVINGGDLFRLQRILGHKDSSVTQRYAHLAPSAFESDWGRMGSADDEKKGEVIELKEKQG